MTEARTKATARKQASGPRRSRSGSETRRRTKSLQIRLAPDEYEELQAEAQSKSVPLAAHMREKILKIVKQGSRRPRKPGPQLRLSGQYLGQLGKIGSNLNQIARQVNMGQAGLADFEEARKEARVLRDLLGKIIRDMTG
jgi:hypothetical protein